MALAQCFFQRDEQIVRLILLNFHVGVAGDAEGVRGDNFHAGEQSAEVIHNDLLHPHKFLHGRGQQFIGVERVEWHKAGQGAGYFDPCKTGTAVVGVANDHGQIHAQVGDVREGVAGVKGQWGQHGEDFPLEIIGQPLDLPLFEVGVIQNVDARLGEARP